jgi:hypothetical protein
MMLPARVLVLAAATMLLTRALPAQEIIMDAGAFVIRRAGTEAGREEFAIRSLTVPAGKHLLAVSTTRQPGREIQQALEVTADHTPVTLQLTESGAGRVVRRVNAQLAGQRFSVRIVSTDGETAREFPVRGRVVLLGDGAYAGYYFLPRPEAGDTRALTLVRSSDARDVAASVEQTGTDTITVADRPVVATRFVVRAADGDERQFWTTSTGDLLQVAIPREGIVATRSELPHH